MYETITEFMMSCSEAVGAVILVGFFITSFLVGISPLIQNYITQLMGM